MRRLLTLLALVTAAAPFSAAPAQAQSRPDPNCSDDRGVDRCSPEQHRRVLELYGVKPIEEHARAGEQVRRVFYVDGYGSDVVAIAFVRSPGRDPTLSVHFPRPDGAPLRPAATALIPREAWEAALDRSAHFHRIIRDAPAPQDPETISLCIHSWVYTVEATDLSEREGGQVTTRRKVEDACEDGLAEAFAGELSALALPLLPYCNALDAELHRNDAQRLGSCWSLEGDRLAAAGAHNLAMRLARLDRPEDKDRARGLFEYNAQLSWEGQSSAEGRAAEDWIERITGPDHGDYYFSRVVGEAADRARIEGELIRNEGTGEKPAIFRAPVTLYVAGTDTRHPQIEKGVIGAFAPVRE